MVIEAMAPESGIEHLRIEGEVHFRAIDLACTVYSDPKQRGVANAAVRVFCDAESSPEHIVHRGGAKGRYLPITVMGAFTKSLCDPANDELARARFFGGLRAIKRARAAAEAAATLSPPPEATPPMTPIEIRDVCPPLRELRTSDLPQLRFAAIDGRLFWAWGDLANAVCKPLGAPLCSSQYRRGMTALAATDITRLSAGKRGMTLMLADARVEHALEALSAREDYDRELSGRVLRRMRELAVEIGAELADKALEAAEHQPAADTAKSIVSQVMGEAPAFPPIPPYPAEATPAIEVLKTVRFEPKSKADQLLDRMAASEAAQLRVADEMDRLGNRLEDAVEALRLAQAGIERRDGQIASLERLIALAGQHLTAAVRHYS